MTEATKIRASIKDGEGELRILIAHPMESGQRKDAAGQTLPAHFVQTLTITVNGKLAIHASLGPAVSKNPLFSFRLGGVKAGDPVTVAWVDNQGEGRSDHAVFT